MNDMSISAVQVRRIPLHCTVSAIAFAIAAFPAYAQSGPASVTASTSAEVVPDIVVTATRRSETAQKIALSMTAVSGEALAKAGIDDSTNLSQVVPNLYAAPGLGAGNVKYSIRGITSQEYSRAASSPIATYFDDVYQAYTIGISSQIFDIQRVEVLRGPQGTLFGKNSTGGAMNYFSQTPQDRTEGYITAGASVGTMHEGNAEAVFNTPLTDNLTMRVSGRIKTRDNYIRDVYYNRELGHTTTKSGRFQLQWKPDDTTTARLLVRASSTNGDPTLYHGVYLPGACTTPGVSPYICTNGVPQPTTTNPLQVVATPENVFEDYSVWGTTLNIQHKAGDFDLTSISAYQHTNYEQKSNDSGLPGDYFHGNAPAVAWQASQELRMATPVDKPLSAVAGAFFMKDHINNTNVIASTKSPAGAPYAIFYGGTLLTTTGAVFGNVTFRATDRLRLIGGLRYSIENRKNNLYGPGYFGFTTLTDAMVAALRNGTLQMTPGFVIRQNEDRTWRKPTWDATVQYDLAPQSMIYARVASGFKSGGYNQSASSPAAVTVVQPETILSYEVGSKNQFLNGTVRINGSLYYYDFSNQQVFSQGGGISLILSNAGKSRVKGGELEVTVLPAHGLSLGGTFGYTDAKFKKFQSVLLGNPVNLSGNSLPYAPKVTSSALASYKIDLAHSQSLTFGTDWSYRTKVYFDPYNLSYTSDGPLLLGNVRVTYDVPALRLSVTAFARNVTDKNYTTFAFFQGNAFASDVYGDRRTIGLEATYKF